MPKISDLFDLDDFSLNVDTEVHGIWYYQLAAIIRLESIITKLEEILEEVSGGPPGPP